MRLLSRRGLHMRNILSDPKAWKGFRILNSWNDGTSLQPQYLEGVAAPSKAQGFVLLSAIYYKPIPTHRKFEDLCRVKLMLNHPHHAYDELLTADHIQFDGYKAAYLHCEQHHEYEDDHYGDVENLDLDADPEEWEPRMCGDDITLEDWQELARLVPGLEPEQEAADVSIGPPGYRYQL
jgi:ATP-dependent DNA helicase PIF1